jgi:hypothetical protein
MSDFSNIVEAANLADNLAKLLDQMKNSSSSSLSVAAVPSVPSMVPSVPSMVPSVPSEPVAAVDNNAAFKSNAFDYYKSTGSNVGYNYANLIANVKKKLLTSNPTKANKILNDLYAATSPADVNQIITDNDLTWAGNWMKGGTKKRRMNKNKRTNRKKARHS